MIRGVLLDIAGVLLQGAAPLPGAVEAVARLRVAGLPVRFLTNSTRSPRATVLSNLRAAGIDAAEDELLTPAGAARSWLIETGYIPHLLIHPDLTEDFDGVPQDGPTAVIVGDAGPYFTYQSLNAAFRVLDEGAPLLALAANRTFRDTDGKRSLDAGAFVAALEYASGQKARLFGKPSEDFFRAATRSMGLQPDEVAMIGDDAEADVAGARDAGVAMAVLVRTGKYLTGDEAGFDPPPSAVAAGIPEAVEAVLSARS